jgi:hypothetical protein
LTGDRHGDHDDHGVIVMMVVAGDHQGVAVIDTMIMA